MHFDLTNLRLFLQVAVVGVSIAAIFSDPREKIVADLREHCWHFPVGYDFIVGHMRALGPYPRSPEETDDACVEPDLLLINPEGRIKVVDNWNAPFARPALAGLLRGARFAQEHRYPIRGALG